jgi:hypothetical protein
MTFAADLSDGKAATDTVASQTPDIGLGVITLINTRTQLTRRQGANAAAEPPNSEAVAEIRALSGAPAIHIQSIPQCRIPA